jgi:hypothetical protein
MMLTFVRAACLVAAFGMIGGCGRSTPPPSPPTPATSIASLGRMYGEYASRHDGVGPADEGAFRSFLESLPAAQKKSMGFDDLSQALTSPRDGQPYVIVYGVSPAEPFESAVGGTPNPAAPPQGAGLQGQPLVVYEQVGQNGLRLVATGFGTSAELTEQAFAEAVPDKL